MSVAPAYKLIKKIKDDRFNEEHLQRYILFIQLGVRDLQTLVVDTNDNRALFFEDYVFGDVRNSEASHDLLKKLYDGHELIAAGFWKEVRFSIKSNKFAQVPEALFTEGAEEAYLQFNARIQPENEIFLSCKSKLSDAVTTFAVDRTLAEWLKSVYAHTKLQFVHQSASLIDGVLNNSNQDPNSLFLYVDRFKLHILSKRDGKLLYYNQFPIKQFSDYVKYIMLVLRALKMDQESGKVILWGYIGKNSPHYHEFSRYIRNVSFGNRPKHLTFGYLFDEVQDHHFFDLYSMTLS